MKEIFAKPSFSLLYTTQWWGTKEIHNSICWDLQDAQFSKLSPEFHQTEFTTFEKGFLGILIKYNVQKV